MTDQKSSHQSSQRNEVQYNGLKNQGATCYLNAVLQCLFMTPEFKTIVERCEAPCSEESLLLQLQKLFRQLSEKTATTEGITRSLHINHVFEQQDAVEYYRKILKAVGTVASKVFEGQMSNITKCGKCGEMVPEPSSFISILLSIDVGNDELFDVKTGLKNFEKHSKLEEEDWMYCDVCGCKTETETWSKIDIFPTVLTLHLKRFDFDYMHMRYKKNECRLDVPINLPKEDNRPQYELYAVINHMGGYSGGHYDAIIRSYENGMWYRFDDYIVTQTSEELLKNSRLPYMLMYRKVLSHPLRILLTGPSRAGKSTVGNIILGENCFACQSGSATVTKEAIAQTVGNVTVVDTPNLYFLKKSNWAEVIDPGPNVLVWVIPISKFSHLQQGLFHAFNKRLKSEITKHKMMIIFTKGRELEKLGQSIEEFISNHRKLRKVVCMCQDRYHVVDVNDGHNYRSELLKKLRKMATSGEATKISNSKI